MRTLVVSFLAACAVRASPTFDEDMRRLVQRANEALAPHGYVFFGIACDETGLRVAVEDYRGVDAAVERLIPFLLAEGIGLPVIFQIIPYRAPA